MPMRPPAGFISAFFDPLKNPNAPTLGTATGGDQSASVAFTAPANVGGSAISSYSAISTPQGIIASAASSPINVTGLTNGTAYTFAVWATNTYGPSAFSAMSGSVTPSLQRGLFMGGDPNGAGTYSNVIDYISISTTGNAIDFGDLTQARFALASCASTTRACAAGGEISGGNTDRIDYVTIVTTGNATTFGSLSSSTNYGTAGCNSSTRGVFAGGLTNWPSNVIEYITIASTGNSTDFGDLTVNTFTNAGCSSSTRGLFAGGNVSATPGGAANTSNVIGYITIASTGNATDFGDLTAVNRGLEGASNATRALFAGGNTENTIQFVTIASTGNATDFGDLVFTTNYGGGSAPSSPTRAVFMGTTASAATCYVNIASTGNALSFGDLSVGRSDLTGTSNSNGGVQ